MTRSMTLIKLYVVNALRSLGQEVQKRTTDTKVRRSCFVLEARSLLIVLVFIAVSYLRDRSHRSVVHEIHLVRLSAATSVGRP
jgi:hypothetical protein